MRYKLLLKCSENMTLLCAYMYICHMVSITPELHCTLNYLNNRGINQSMRLINLKYFCSHLVTCLMSNISEYVLTF